MRYDGGHKRDDFLLSVVAPFVEWVSVCPEVESGMGLPRPPVRLELPPEGADPRPRMVDPQSGADHTESMRRYAAARVAALAKEDLDGWILKQDSPSCGLERVQVFDRCSLVRRDGVGLFAAELVRVMPLLPVEDEGRLKDPDVLRNFLERASAYRRQKAALQARGTAGDSR